MNEWIGKGRTTADIELRQTPSGKSSARFTLACDGYKDKDGNRTSNFIPCVAWGQRAEALAKYVNKGQEILVRGELRSGKYADKQNPEITHYTLECYVDNFEFCGKKSEGATAAEATMESSFEELISEEEMPI